MITGILCLLMYIANVRFCSVRTRACKVLLPVVNVFTQLATNQSVCVASAGIRAAKSAGHDQVVTSVTHDNCR